MSTWSDIESAVVSAVSGIVEGAAPLLPTVRGHAAADRKTLTTAILRERLPAAYVIVEGREDAARSSMKGGAALVTILLASRDLRSDGAARTGGVDTIGVFTLAPVVTALLQGYDFGQAGRMFTLREEAWPAPDGTALWEIAFVVRSRAELNVPTFGGAVLTGTNGSVRVDLGELRAATSTFSFPGIDGVFERRLGARERPIWWRGELREMESELNALEAAIENEVRSAQPKTMLDAYGRQLDHCVLRSFRRVGGRDRDPVTGESVQDFELEFAQLRG